VFGSKVLDGLNCTVKTIPKNDLQKYSSANLAAFGACYFQGGWGGHYFQRVITFREKKCYIRLV